MSEQLTAVTSEQWPDETMPQWWSLLKGDAARIITLAEVQSPMWWLLRLEVKLRLEQPALLRFERYYRGFHDAPGDVPPSVQQAYQWMLARLTTNYMRTVVDVTRERMKVQGLRLPAEPGKPEQTADLETWAIWQANGLDAWSQVAITEALKKRRSYWSVWPATVPGGEPTIAVEDPLQVIVEHDPEDRRRRAAALKMWIDDWTGDLHANLFLPKRVYKFRREGLTGWVEREDSIDNPFGEVPIVPMVNRPSLLLDPDGESQIEDLVEIQDRLNENTLNRMLNGRMGAFRQRWVTGLDIPIDPATGRPVEEYVAAVGRLWSSADKDVKFGSFDVSPMDPYVNIDELEVQHIANLSRIPRHYFTQSGQAPSGDAMKSADSSLVAMVTDKLPVYGEAIEETLRLARRAKGLATPMVSSVIWADPQFRTVGEQTDAVVKQVQSNLIPWQVALEELGKTPSEIARIERLRAADQIGSAFADFLRGSNQQTSQQQVQPNATGA